MSNYVGKVVAYSAPQASISPDNGDGTQLSDQLELELDLKCHPVYGQTQSNNTSEQVGQPAYRPIT